MRQLMTQKKTSKAIFATSTIPSPFLGGYNDDTILKTDYSANPGGGKCMPAMVSLLSRAYCIKRLRLSMDFSLSIS